MYMCVLCVGVVVLAIKMKNFFHSSNISHSLQDPQAKKDEYLFQITKEIYRLIGFKYWSIIVVNDDLKCVQK